MRRRHRAILFVLILLGGGTLWLLLGRERVEEGRCRLRRQAIGNPATNQAADLAWQLLEPELSRPAEAKDLPHGFDQPCFYHVEIHGERLTVALDWSHGRLCLDTDRDGRFANERCFRAKSVKLTPRGNQRWRFGPICWNVDNGTDQERVAFYLLHHAVDRPTLLSAYPAYYRSGKLRLNAQVYQVAVVDGDYDGRFGAVVSLPIEGKGRWPRSDVFAIDGNRDGKFETSLYAHRSEVMPLSRMVMLGGCYYAIDVSPDGSQLGLTPVEPTFGRLAVEPADAKLQLRLWSDAADQFLSPIDGPWELPVGAYQTLYGVLTLQDSQGDNWTFSTLRDVGGITLFQIEPGQTTRLRIGPPFVVKVDVQRVDEGTLSISPVLVGCAGEQYQADFRRNNRRAPERTFTIVDEKGTVLVADKFQYG